MPYISQSDLNRLNEIAKTATMENASFGFPNEKFHAPLESYGPNVETTPDQFIKERTKLWRESWIIAPLQEILKRYDTDSV